MLFVLVGRTGQLCVLALVLIWGFWAVPPRWRWLSLLFPVLVLGISLLVSSQFSARMESMVKEVVAFVESPLAAESMALDAPQKGQTPLYQENHSPISPQKASSNTSSGQRLQFWHAAVHAIGQRPWLGYGVGSFEKVHVQSQIELGYVPPLPVGNPHQEFLMWAMQLGLLGVVLVLGFFVVLYKDTQSFCVYQRRALLSVLLVLFVACLGNSALYDGFVGDFFCALVGLLMAWGWQTRPTSTHATLKVEK